MATQINVRYGNSIMEEGDAFVSGKKKKFSIFFLPFQNSFFLQAIIMNNCELSIFQFMSLAKMILI
jgi:hypothetical protein